MARAYSYPRDRRHVVAQALGVPGAWSIPEYGVWIDMRRRCENADRHNYPGYGGRGIAVCDRWQDFSAFYADMGPRPSKAHTLERLDNNKGYEPTNCVWATPQRQANNRRSNRIVQYLGTAMSLRDAIRAAGDVAARDTVRRRLQLGWPIERAVETPPDARFQRGKRA